MKIALACDHGAFAYKELLKTELTEQGHIIDDFGTYSLDSCDYPDFASKAAQSVADGVNERGIVLCSTGIGVSIAANKVKGIRCALCSETYSARLTREHNDSNVLALGARVIGEDMMRDIVHVWLTTEFSELAKHQKRIDKLAEMEK